MHRLHAILFVLVTGMILAPIATSCRVIFNLQKLGTMATMKIKRDFVLMLLGAVVGALVSYSVTSIFSIQERRKIQEFNQFRCEMVYFQLASRIEGAIYFSRLLHNELYKSPPQIWKTPAYEGLAKDLILLSRHKKEHRNLLVEINKCRGGKEVISILESMSKNVVFVSVIYMAAMDRIDRGYYEPRMPGEFEVILLGLQDMENSLIAIKRIILRNYKAALTEI